MERENGKARRQRFSSPKHVTLADSEHLLVNNAYEVSTHHHSGERLH